MKARALLCVAAAALLVGCGLPGRSSAGSQSVVGAWELVHMSAEPLPLDRLPAEGLGRGRMEFRADGTFEGTLSAPGVAPGTRLKGTYAVEGDVITIDGSAGHPPTKSKLRFEQDYMVQEPVERHPLSYAFYYRRVR